jgi:hypothetical protein
VLQLVEKETNQPKIFQQIELTECFLATKHLNAQNKYICIVEKSVALNSSFSTDGSTLIKLDKRTQITTASRQQL